MLKVIFFSVLAFIIFFAPFAFGSTELWSETILHLAILSIFFLYLAKSIKQGFFECRKTVLNVFFATFILYAVFQLVFKLTKVPYETLFSVKASVFYFLLFFAIVNYIDTMREINILVSLIVVSGFCLSVFAIIQYASGADKIFWLRKPSALVFDFFGPFGSANVFASYISAIMLLAIGNFVNEILHAKTTVPKHVLLRQKITSLSQTILNEKLVLMSFSLVLMLMALLFTRSRAGILLFFFTLLIFMLFVLTRKRLKKIALIVLFLFVIALFMANLLAGLGKTEKEIMSIFQKDALFPRVFMIVSASSIIRNYPFFGIGLGSFDVIYPSYQKLDFWESGDFSFNSDLFQFLAEAGYVGVAVILLPFLIFIANSWRITNKSGSRTKYLIGLGLILSIIFLLLHGTIELPFQYPAILTIVTVFLALIFLVVNLDIFDNTLKVRAPSIRIPFRLPFNNKAGYAFLSFFFIILAFLTAKPFIADFITRYYPSDRSFKKAFLLDGNNSELHYRYYKSLVNRYNSGEITGTYMYSVGEEALTRAIKLNPYQTTYREAGGYLNLWQRDYKKAAVAFREAMLLEPLNTRIKMLYAYSMLQLAVRERNENLREVLLSKGLACYKQAGGFPLKYVVTDDEDCDTLIEILKKENITIR